MKLHSFLFILFSFFLFSSGRTPDPVASTDAILSEAYKTAAKEHKNVFIIFHASWCGWCHKMDSAMNSAACKNLFDGQYVIRHLVVLESKDKVALENPGAMDLMKKYNGDKGGIPFWLIFDKNGKLLADSQIRPDGVGLDAPGKNVGCPSEKEEIVHFMKVLKKSSGLNNEQLAVIEKTFTPPAKAAAH